jgi:hypothetical protein
MAAGAAVRITYRLLRAARMSARVPVGSSARKTLRSKHLRHGMATVRDSVPDFLDSVAEIGGPAPELCG